MATELYVAPNDVTGQIIVLPLARPHRVEPALGLSDALHAHLVAHRELAEHHGHAGEGLPAHL